MLTAAQITAGTARLVDGKLTDEDVSKLTSVFEMFFAELKTKYGYEYASSLAALDDTGSDDKNAAQVAACIIKMEELGFGVASLTGNVNYKEKDEYAQYVLIAFSKIYSIPFEWSQYDLRRRRTAPRASQTAPSARREYVGGFWHWDSERSRR